MGCRTRANEYYAATAGRKVQSVRRPEMVVEGNVVRKNAPVKAAPVRIKKNRKKMTSVSAAKAFRRQKAVFAVCGVIGSVVLMFLCAFMLMTMEESSRLADEVETRELLLDEMSVANDAREYEIDNSVDLNYVISVATEELGMVRSSLSQVVTYRTKDTEYLQQVAKVPSD